MTNNKVTPLFGSWQGAGGNKQVNTNIQKSSREQLRAAMYPITTMISSPMLVKLK